MILKVICPHCNKQDEVTTDAFNAKQWLGEWSCVHCGEGFYVKQFKLNGEAIIR